MQIAFSVCVLVCSAFFGDETQPSDAHERELKALEGTWEGYVVEGSGENPDRGPVHLRLTIAGSNMSAVDLGEGDKDMGSGTYQIDTSKSVKELDARGVILPGRRERMFPGIYEVDGDVLKWCVDNRGKGRPTEFRSASGKYLLILKRKTLSP